ncbi:MAG: DegT/DnrJ/EryC1/StrS family aminotransferase [Planctomycetaceae bacterium]
MSDSSNEPLFPNGPPSWPMHSESVTAALAAAAEDGSWGKYHGPNTERFRSDLLTWSGCSHVELCSSGTAASELALRAFKVGNGDEVILAAYDYAASFKNTLSLGAMPVLVDVDPADCTIRIDQIEEAISPKTKAIVVSHLHGGVCDMPAVMKIAERHGIAVLEDACQATGGTLSGRRLGSFGTLGIISFGGSKLMTAGRGGAIFGNDEQLFQRMHLHSFRGNTAYPLSELQAAVLVPQLEVLEAANRHRTKRVRDLQEAIANLDGLDCTAIRTDTEPAWYKVGLRVTDVAKCTRDEFATAARGAGVACDRSLHALHTVHSKRRYRAIGDLSGAECVNENSLQLHHPILLGTPGDIQRVATVFARILEG